MARPSFKPTEEHRRTVRTWSAHGIGHEQIAAELGITPKTLRKHFGAELRRGLIGALLSIRQKLLREATAGRNTAALIYANKVWSASVAKQSAPDGQPMPPPQIIFREDGEAAQQATAQEDPSNE